MKEIEITIKVYNRERCAEEERNVTAYADAKYPGLAIHGPWELGNDDWRITHVASGLIITTFATRAAATAALPLIAAIQDWNRPMEEVAAHGEPERNKYLRAYIAAIVGRVRNDRAAALQAVVESGTIKGTALEAALGDFTCDKMRRAWRSRSPVTQSNWASRARKLLGTESEQAAEVPLAAALYAAASDFCDRHGRFRPVDWTPHTWGLFAGRVRAYHANPPDKALSRWQYSVKHRKSRQPA